MGNTQGHLQNPEFLSASRRFSRIELQELKKLWTSLAAQSRSNGQYVIASVFQVYYGIHGSLGARLFNLATQLRKDQRLYYEDFIILKAKYDRGSPDEVENICFQLLDLNGDGHVQRDEVEAVMLSILETVIGPQDAILYATLPDDSLQAFLNFSMKDDSEYGPTLSMDEFRHWCTVVPSVKKFLAGIFSSPGTAGTFGRQVPTLSIPGNMPSMILLRKEYAWHIAGILQTQEAQDWVLLYHSSVNGFSFNTFLKNVGIAQGCTILLVKDKHGYVYGGYASQTWERSSNFYGDMKSFLFSLHPRAAIYKPSGLNNNLQWCAINYTSESIPNGIGFGGQINHWALFISSSFDQGQTQPSVTFNSPILSERSDFVPDIIECWGVVIKGQGAGSKGVSALEGTILERFKEDRQIMNMVGMANASDSI
ncbi:hypothetical protein O6H91_09G065400 [Diphasiastrum complanatum]|nr:hypothetical protein O6H91_09G065400 [Diphasiastrum complanatum]KAJ7544124.1 hypothetical protein O6H91_09G065400 [Diphasiastrum complanatum]KAJ7544125.1 hypothetical protein O6H91_09G065400 [Diphasiastrum complanatum]KAJ7544126.1 hypothetical protein O6H91_09G065400 [Diphasiastrum complanatum]KAJ7544127.1 hypothetical protein O6H91_09G065400 [Diphasiastrum complanatum]